MSEGVELQLWTTEQSQVEVTLQGDRENLMRVLREIKRLKRMDPYCRAIIEEELDESQ